MSTLSMEENEAVDMLTVTVASESLRPEAMRARRATWCPVQGRAAREAGGVRWERGRRAGVRGRNGAGLHGAGRLCAAERTASGTWG